MRAFCITIFGLVSSEQQATRTIRSGEEFGLEISPFAATHKFEARKVASEYNINRVAYDYIDRLDYRSLRDSQLGCFMSHLRIWEISIKFEVPVIIFEHDAILTAGIPRLPDNSSVINLQDSIWNDESWPYYERVSLRLMDQGSTQVPKESTNGLVPCKYVCLPSACAYWVSPKAALNLVRTAKTHGALPVDVFINKKIVDIQDLVPFPAIGLHTASTVSTTDAWSGFIPPPST